MASATDFLLWLISYIFEWFFEKSHPNGQMVKRCLSQSVPIKHYAMKMYGGVAVYLNAFVTVALDDVKWWASFPGRFIPKKSVLDTHWLGGWVGRRAGLDAVEKRKTYLISGHEPRTVLDTKTERLTDRQSKCDSDSEKTLTSSGNWGPVSTDVRLNGPNVWRQTQDYDLPWCNDMQKTIFWKISPCGPLSSRSQWVTPRW
jgi:hypothetical protein